jgi:hypothetical protein
LTFNEPVLAPSLVMSDVTLLSPITGKGSTFADAPLAISLVNITSLEVNVSIRDMNRIKIAIYGLKSDNTNDPLTQVLIANNSVNDFFKNPIIGNTLQSLIPADRYIQDNVPPLLVNSSLDLGAGIITLIFDEVIDFKSLKSTNIQMLSSIDRSSAVMITLSNYSTLGFGVDFAVIVDIGLYGVDLVLIDDTAGVGEKRDNTFFSIVGVKDLAGNSAPSGILQAGFVIKDLTQPILQSFDFLKQNYQSVASVRIILFFSKGIVKSTFFCSDFKFQDQPGLLPIHTVVLLDSQCTIITVGRNVTFIVPQSVFGTNQPGEIGTKLSKTFINIPAGVRGQDKFSNTIALLSQEASIQAGAQLIKFLLDMNSGLVTLVFSSAIDRGTFNPLKLGFYSLASGQSIFLSSSTGSALRPPLLSIPARPVSNSVALLTLGTTDLNRLKSIIPSERFIFILINENALNDTQGSPVVPRLLTDFVNIQPSVFYPDTVPPLIVSTTLDMGLHLLVIVLNEPAALSSISITG